jgi:hypothetical protein
MTIETQLLNKLKSTQASYAIDALKAPGGKQEFDFGYRCGYISGLESAIAILLSLYDEEENGDRDL